MSVYTITTYNGYTLYSFLSGTDVISFSSQVTAQVLIVGGGGGGGYCLATEGGGGGGAGEMITGQITFNANTKYTIAVGKGGGGGIYNPHQSDYASASDNTLQTYLQYTQGTNGEPSKIISGTSVKAIALGGGGGGSMVVGIAPSYSAMDGRKGAFGGSGGGGCGYFVDCAGGTAKSGSMTGITSGNSYVNSGGTGTNIRNGGGGGGADAVGQTSDVNVYGNGGNGKSWLYSGNTYAGGGGGGSVGETLTPGSGGSGGGGRGGYRDYLAGTDGSANTGGGGGGRSGGYAAAYGGESGGGGNGGSGIIILAFPTPFNTTVSLTGTGLNRETYIRADHLACYYPFNGDVYDYSTGTPINNLALYYAELSTNDKKLSSTAMRLLKKPGQYIKLPNITVTGNGLTIHFWINIKSYSGDTRIFDFGMGSPSSNIVLYLTSAGVLTLQIFRANNTTDYCSNTVATLSTNTWYNITIIMDPAHWTKAKVYIGETLYTLTAGTGTFFYPNGVELTNCFIGKGYSSSNLTDVADMYINNFMIFHRALHESEVTVLRTYFSSFNLVYNDTTTNTVNINNNGLQYYYTFNTNFKNEIAEMGVADISWSNISVSTGDSVAGTGSLYKKNVGDSFGRLPVFAPGKWGYTISVWAKYTNPTDSYVGGRILDFCPNTDKSIGIVLFYYNPDKSLRIYSVSYANSVGNYVFTYNYTLDSNWHHYCIVHYGQSSGKYPNENSTARLYVDGVMVGEDTSSRYPYSHLNPNYQNLGDNQYIGKSNWAQDTSTDPKYINNLIIFGRAITNDEIRYLYSMPTRGALSFTANPTTPYTTDIMPYKVNGASFGTPTGSIVAYMGTVDPDGWVICDGTTRYSSDTRYSRLIQLGIGTGTTAAYTPPNYRAGILRGQGDFSYNNTTYGARKIGQEEAFTTTNTNAALCCHGTNWIVKL